MSDGADDDGDSGLEDTDPGGSGFSVDDLFDSTPSGRGGDGPTEEQTFAEDEETAVPSAREDSGVGDGDDDEEADAERGWDDALDGEVFRDASGWPAAGAEDFEDDAGDWSPEDYGDAARALFGDDPHFGEAPERRFWEAGFAPASDAYRAWLDGALSGAAPGAPDTLRLFWSGASVVAAGFVTPPVLALMRQLDPNLDLSRVRVTEPARQGDAEPPAPLPAALAALEPRAAVDLRALSSPVGDQGPTSRCSAFAWTHALELVRRAARQGDERLSCSYAMLGFQKMMGEEQGYAHAYAGGDGTVGGVEPGRVLVERGTCLQELWPDDEEEPRVSERHLREDAATRRLEADLQVIDLGDVKRVLSAGCPVHVGMNTGPSFAALARDGLVDATEAPSGRHGRHAMLMVGYTGNYFILKNSWGIDWGCDGYCFVPKRVLAAAEPTFVAILHARARIPAVAASPTGEEPPSPARVLAPWGQARYPATLGEVHGELGHVTFDGGTSAWLPLASLSPPPSPGPLPAIQPWLWPGQRVWAPVSSQLHAATVWATHGRLVHVRFDTGGELWVEAGECRA